MGFLAPEDLRDLVSGESGAASQSLVIKGGGGSADATGGLLSVASRAQVVIRSATLAFANQAGGNGRGISKRRVL